jgi:hypothetical protein
VIAVRVRVRGGAVRAAPESLLQELHNLEVGYIIFIVHVHAGTLNPAFGLQGYVTELLFTVTALLDR